MEETFTPEQQPSEHIVQGISAIIYDEMDAPYYLILQRHTNWKGWEFVKGKLEGGESEEAALNREILEETGIRKFKVMRKLDVKREFMHDGKKHSFTVYLVEASMNIPVHLDPKEHNNYLWGKKDKVLENLTWDDEKKVFMRALQVLKR